MKNVQKTIIKILTFLVTAFLTLVILYLLYKTAYVTYNLLTYSVSRGVFSLIVSILIYGIFFNEIDYNSNYRHCPYFNRNYCEGCPKINPYNHKYIDFYANLQWCDALYRYVDTEMSPEENIYEHSISTKDAEFIEKNKSEADKSKSLWNISNIKQKIIRFNFYLLMTVTIYALLYFKVIRIIVSIIVSLFITHLFFLEVSP